MTKLNKLNINETATITSLEFTGIMRKRLLDLGIAPNTKITALYKSPFGSPTAYFIKGSTIAIRDSDAEKIIVQ